jgi:CheY-like chemotaxis protein
MCCDEACRSGEHRWIGLSAYTALAPASGNKASTAAMVALQPEPMVHSVQRTRKFDASSGRANRCGPMDVLIVEHDALLAAVLTDALADDGLEAAVVPDDEEALEACQPDMPQVVVTGINRRRDDLRGLQFGRAIRNRCPLLGVIYMAALWPLQLTLNARERFLSKPLAMKTLIQTVRELLPT